MKLHSKIQERHVKTGFWALPLAAIGVLGFIVNAAAQSDDGGGPGALREYRDLFGVYRPGGNIVQTTAEISGTSDYSEHENQEIYRDARTDMDSYVFKVPNGTYRVDFRFAEIEEDSAGQRVFGIKLQGEAVVDRLDVFEKVGKNRAYALTSQDVRVTDGLLQVEFVRIVGSPLVSAMSVEGDLAGRPAGSIEGVFYDHINCGGPSFRGYHSDLWDLNRY